VSESVAHYQLLDKIGAGALGELFKARDTRLGRTVALRRVTGLGDSGLKERLLAEARALTALSHPFVAALFDAGEDGGQVYLATEFVPGETLTRIVAGQPLHPRRAAELAAQIADGLAEAHARGFVHGDVRPDNVIVTPKGQAKLLELGLAPYTAGGTSRAAAAEGRAAGPAPHAALRYLSPEQALGEKPDSRTDVFSLGAVLYTMLTGRAPFAADTADLLAIAVLQAKPVPPSHFNPEVPFELDAVVARAMMKSLDRRYQSAAEMAADLRAAAMMLEVRAGQAAEDVHDEKPRAPSNLRTIVLAIVLVALIVAGAFVARGFLAP
jgi:serine/threonine protein kinase